MAPTTSYSQLGQDIKVIERCNYMRCGYFVEVGAADGIQLSNTYKLEQEYEWTGICIEPNPETFQKLQKNRKCRTISAVVSDIPGQSVEFNIAEDHLYSGIVSTIDKHKSSLDGGQRMTRQTRSLTGILAECRAPFVIDYLSLDTEGSEELILRGVDFETYQFNEIHVEHNFQEPRRTNMGRLLENNDYVFVGPNNFDDIYIHKHYLSKLKKINIKVPELLPSSLTGKLE